MKRIDDLTFINNINDAICENRIFALRIKKGNPYFLGLMECSAKIAYSFVVNLEDCLLQKESVLCGTLQDSIDHVLDHEIFESELQRKFRDSLSNAAEAFLKRIECHKRKGEIDSEDHDIFMVSDTEFNNIVDALCDGDYIFVIKDNDPVDDSETNCFEFANIPPKREFVFRGTKTMYSVWRFDKHQFNLFFDANRIIHDTGYYVVLRCDIEKKKCSVHISFKNTQESIDLYDIDDWWKYISVEELEALQPILQKEANLQNSYSQKNKTAEREVEKEISRDKTHGNTDYVFSLNGIELLLPEIRKGKMTSLYENGDPCRCAAVLERGYVDIEVNITTPEQCGTALNDNSPLISYFVCVKRGDNEDDWESDGYCDLHPVQVNWNAPDWKKQLEIDMLEALDEYVIHNGLSYDEPNPPTSTNTENSLPETYTVISYWIGERESSKVWLYNTYKEATEGMARLWEQSFNLALEDEDFDEKNSYHEESFGVIAWDDNGLRRCFEVVNTSKTENIL